MPGTVWERVSVPEMRLCVGAAAELREAAGGILPGMQAALRQHGAVYGQGCGGAGLPSGVGDLCAPFEGWRAVDMRRQQMAKDSHWDSP